MNPSAIVRPALPCGMDTGCPRGREACSSASLSSLDRPSRLRLLPDRCRSAEPLGALCDSRDCTGAWRVVHMRKFLLPGSPSPDSGELCCGDEDTSKDSEELYPSIASKTENVDRKLSQQPYG